MARLTRRVVQGVLVAAVLVVIVVSAARRPVRVVHRAASSVPPPTIAATVAPTRASRLADAKWSPSLVSVSQSCPRVVYPSSSSVGLAEQFVAFVVALLEANTTHSTLALKGTAPDRLGMTDAAQLSAFRPKGGTVVQGGELAASLEGEPCFRNVTLVVDPSKWCSANDCAKAFRLARSFFEIAHPQPRRVHSGPLRCVWAVEDGEGMAAPSNVLFGIARLLSNDTLHTVFSSAPLCAPSDASKRCDFFYGMRNAAFSHSTDEIEMARQIVSADVVVSCGSALALAATGLSSSSQIVLALPQETMRRYDRGDVILLSEIGAPPDVAALGGKLSALRSGVAKVDFCKLFTSPRPCFPAVRDRLSAMEWRNICDFVFFGLDPFPGRQLYPMQRRFSVDAFNKAVNPVLFVGTRGIYDFLKLLPQIRVRFVLLVADADESNPGLLHQSHVDAILKNELVVHWYGTNCDRFPHPTRFSCLPIGNGQWSGARELLQAAAEMGMGLVNGYKPNLSQVKDITVLAAFALYEGLRNEIWASACTPKGAFAAFVTCVRNAVQGAEFYSMVARSKWVISPLGIGFDTYRTWEALWMDSYPIVQSHPTMDSLYTDLPVLIVKDLTKDLNATFLDEMYAKFRARMDWRYEKLYCRHWRQVFDRQFTDPSARP